MISFVCWKWVDDRLKRRFESAHVNVLAAQIGRHYEGQHRVVCVTDDPKGLDPRIVHVPMPVTGHEALTNPHDLDVIRRVRPGFRRMIRRTKFYPSCYRRLWNFSADAKKALGERIFAIDIDVVVMDDLTPLVERTASFVGWCDPRFERRKIAGGAYLLTAGAHTDVWDDFRGHESIQAAVKAGYKGSDQGWMSLKLFPPEQSWSSHDGVVKINWLGRSAPPRGTRLVFTNGAAPPWDTTVRADYPWVKEHWQ